MRLRAHAKLNLSLAVGPLREDGYHHVETIVQTVDLADELEVAPRRRGIVVTNDAGISQEQDLCDRAARAVLAAKGVDAGVGIDVVKRIPIGSGLGGGSSDAAAIVWAVDRLFPPRLPEEQLTAICAAIGTDVPLFLTGGRLRANGRGERVVEHRATPVEWYLLVVPPFSCSTQAVYAAHRGASAPVSGTAALGRNDLLAAAATVAPSIVTYVEAVNVPGARFSGLTGSGSACYAAFADEETASRTAARLRERLPEAEFWITRAVPYGIEMREGSDACTSP
jgi:4-diphosphocytidyl-2C-methyl-D-erythritol kinase